MLDSMRQKLQKRPRGVRGLQIFCIIFLLGNLLFFSTGIFMPKHYKDVEIAPIGTELELGEYTLTITSWDWAEKDRAFEIIFEVKDLSLNREPGYTFRFRCGDSHYRYKIYRDLGDLLVVRVSGVSSRFAQVAMTVKAGSASRSIYMDDRTMAHVERLEERSDAAYRIHAVEGKAAGHRLALQQLEQQTEEKNADLRLAYEKLEALQASKADKTPQQQEEIGHADTWQHQGHRLHRPGQQQGQDDLSQWMMKKILPDSQGQQHGHDQGHQGEQPGVLGKNRKGRPSIFYIGQFQQMGNKGHMGPQLNVLQDQIFHQLIQGHQDSRKDGIGHGLLLQARSFFLS